MRRASSGLPISPARPAISPPASRMSFTVRARSPSPRAQMKTRAPCRASAAAMALPMPRLPPVISATLPDNFCPPSLFIPQLLYHSRQRHQNREKLSETFSLRPGCPGDDCPTQSLGGYDFGTDHRHGSGVGAVSIFLRKNLQPLFHDFRHRSVFFLPPFLETRPHGSIGTDTARPRVARPWAGLRPRPRLDGEPRADDVVVGCVRTFL